MKEQVILFGVLLLLTNIVGQYMHLLGEADKLKKNNALLGLPFSFRNDLIRKDFYAIQMAFLVNLGLIIIFCWWAYDEELSKRFEAIVMLLSLTSGYTGSSLGLKILSKANDLASEKITNLHVENIFTETKKEKMEEYIWELEFENASDVVDFESTQYSIEDFCTMTGGEFSTTKIIYTEEPSFNEVTAIRINTTSYSAAPIKRPINPK